MIKLIRTDAKHKDFIALVGLLDADLSVRDGEDHGFYHQFNAIDTIKYAVVAYFGDTAVGCGAIKRFDEDTMEVKRMYTHPDSRGKGIASKIVAELEQWAKEMSVKKCVLETGKKQPEAIQLYEKMGYMRTPNYGQYVGVENSICFEKIL